MAQYNISYSWKVINRRSPSPFSMDSRARTATFGENMNLQHEYIIYVKKADYEKAKAIINGKIK